MWEGEKKGVFGGGAGGGGGGGGVKAGPRREGTFLTLIFYFKKSSDKH